MAILVAAPKALLADKGDDGDRLRESLLIRGILPIIPPRSNKTALSFESLLNLAATRLLLSLLSTRPNVMHREPHLS
jgi:hypothetical protein